jgi:hypothetical protein
MRCFDSAPLPPPTAGGGCHVDKLPGVRAVQGAAWLSALQHSVPLSKWPGPQDSVLVGVVWVQVWARVLRGQDSSGVEG